MCLTSHKAGEEEIKKKCACSCLVSRREGHLLKHNALNQMWDSFAADKYKVSALDSRAQELWGVHRGVANRLYSDHICQAPLALAQARLPSTNMMRYSSHGWSVICLFKFAPKLYCSCYIHKKYGGWYKKCGGISPTSSPLWSVSIGSGALF